MLELRGRVINIRDISDTGATVEVQFAAAANRGVLRDHGASLTLPQLPLDAVEEFKPGRHYRLTLEDVPPGA